MILSLLRTCTGIVQAAKTSIPRIAVDELLKALTTVTTPDPTQPRWLIDIHADCPEQAAAHLRKIAFELERKRCDPMTHYHFQTGGGSIEKVV